MTTSLKIRKNWERHYPSLNGQFPEEWHQEKQFPLKQRLLEYIYHFKHTSLAELGKYFQDEFKGEYTWHLTGYENIILWVNMSKNAADSLSELLKEEWINMKQTQVLVYMADGAGLRLDVAKSKRQYKKPRWLPVVLNPTPKCEGILV